MATLNSVLFSLIQELPDVVRLKIKVSDFQRSNLLEECRE